MTPAPPISKSTKGVLVSLVGVLVLTPDTLLIRATGNLHPPTLLFYRYGFHAFSILSFIIAKNGRKSIEKITEIGWIGVLCGLIFGTSNIFFTTAVQYTAVANVLVILAINPLFAALFSWILVGDVIKTRTSVTMLVGLGAIGLIFYDEISGGSSSRSIMGNIFACCTCVLWGLFFAVVRYCEVKQSSKINMVPCNVVAGLFVAIGKNVRVIYKYMHTYINTHMHARMLHVHKHTRTYICISLGQS
jgi:drug/metabolite transporter (DMT)-like permease